MFMDMIRNVKWKSWGLCQLSKPTLVLVTKYRDGLPPQKRKKKMQMQNSDFPNTLLLTCLNAWPPHAQGGCKASVNAQAEAFWKVFNFCKRERCLSPESLPTSLNVCFPLLLSQGEGSLIHSVEKVRPLTECEGDTVARGLTLILRNQANTGPRQKRGGPGTQGWSRIPSVCHSCFMWIRCGRQNCTELVFTTLEVSSESHGSPMERDLYGMQI